MPRGGHFAAFEEPELLAYDNISFVSKLEAREQTDTNALFSIPTPGNVTWAVRAESFDCTYSIARII